MNLDPIVVLAGATFKAGNRMLCKELLDMGGKVSVALYQAADPALAETTDSYAAVMIDDRIQRGSPALLNLDQ